MMILNNRQAGFTLLELMMVIAIIGILASVAMPAYYQYTHRAKFSEVVIAASSVKGLVDMCYQTRGAYTLANCDTLAKIGGAVADITNGANVASITMNAGDEGEFTVVGAATVDSLDYVITPSPSGNSITWESSGTCVTSGIC